MRGSLTKGSNASGYPGVPFVKFLFFKSGIHLLKKKEGIF
jgi:hypothetical protein